MIICDLHTHSTASDGSLTPSEVVKKAFDRGVKYLALTDHDTLSGIPEAIETAKNLDITFIPGIELSTNFCKETVHVLGYFKGEGYKNEDLNLFLQDLKTKRINRAKEIVSRLKKYHDINIKVEDVLRNGKDTIARPHIAKTIIEAGYDYSYNYIFDNYLGDNCPSYIPANKMSTEDGIALLHKYGAIAVIAHPILFKKITLKDISHLDFEGIEGVYPLNELQDENNFKDFAKNHNLIITCGSDSHGMEDTDDKHGTIGSMSLDSEYVAKLLLALDFINN